MLNLHWNIPIVSDGTGVVPEGLMQPPAPGPRVRQVSMREIKQSRVGASNVLKIHGFILVLKGKEKHSLVPLEGVKKPTYLENW